VADKTGIEWTEATWNPVVGCTHVSEGCEHCYAAREASGRLRNLPTYAGLAEGGRFTGEVRLLPDRLDQPLRWRRPRRIFVNSMSDLFHRDVPDLFIEQVFDVMEQAKQHTFQVLTKRPGRMRAFVRAREGRKAEYARKFDDCPTEAMRNSPAAQWARQRAATPPSNIWLGVSIENQHWADIRVPVLLDTPAAVRWLSCEPLLGPVDLGRWMCSCGGSRWVDDENWQPAYQPWDGERAPGDGRIPCGLCNLGGWDVPDAPGPRIGWVVAGGESGPKARPMQLDWARGLRDQCRATGVPFLFKQWGEWAPRCRLGLSDGHETHHCSCNGRNASHPTDLRRVGKKAAGRELDGRVWDEYPTAVTA
jgi:protein gp37